MTDNAIMFYFFSIIFIILILLHIQKREFTYVMLSILSQAYTEKKKTHIVYIIFSHSIKLTKYFNIIGFNNKSLFVIISSCYHDYELKEVFKLLKSLLI